MFIFEHGEKMNPVLSKLALAYVTYVTHYR